MPDIPIEISKFKGSRTNLNGNRNLTASKRRVIKTAQTFGAQFLATGAPTNQHAVSLAAYKALAVKVAMDFSGNRVTRPTAYTGMDPTEKGNISFWTGMTMAALVADQVLGVSRLIHAGSLPKRKKGTNRLAKVNPASRSLADFVGRDATNAWHVVEAKARQTEPGPSTWTRWKNQTATIASIGGVNPATRSVCYTQVARNYSLKLEDPRGKGDLVKVRLEFEAQESDLVEAYYGPLRDLLTHAARDDIVFTTKRGETDFTSRLVAYDSADREYIFVGMTDKALEAVRDGTYPAAEDDFDGDDFYAGSDGIVLFTSLTNLLSDRDAIPLPELPAQGEGQAGQA